MGATFRNITLILFFHHHHQRLLGFSWIEITCAWGLVSCNATKLGYKDISVLSLAMHSREKQKMKYCNWTYLKYSCPNSSIHDLPPCPSHDNLLLWPKCVATCPMWRPVQFPCDVSRGVMLLSTGLTLKAQVTACTVCLYCRKTFSCFLGTAKMSKCWHIRDGAGIRHIWQHITWFTHILTNVWQLLNEWESWHFLFLDNQCSPKKKVFIFGNRTADLQRLFEKQLSKNMM